MTLVGSFVQDLWLPALYLMLTTSGYGLVSGIAGRVVQRSTAFIHKYSIDVAEFMVDFFGLPLPPPHTTLPRFLP